MSSSVLPVPIIDNIFHLLGRGTAGPAKGKGMTQLQLAGRHIKRQVPDIELLVQQRGQQCYLADLCLFRLDINPADDLHRLFAILP